MNPLNPKRASVVLASAALLGGLATALPAAATTSATTAATAACTMTVGSITSGGDIANTDVTATSPITAKRTAGVHLFTPGVAKFSSTWTTQLTPPSGRSTGGRVVLNSALYSAWYGTKADGTPQNGISNGSKGWQGYHFVGVSTFSSTGSPYWSAQYGLRDDGVVYRWSGENGGDVARYTGFASVKTMALISQTKSYDTFLANARGGALYTIRFARDPKVLPVVKKLRTSTWETFENLIAQKCGTQSTLLTAIDKETGAAYLYAVGHANGASTVIQGLGKVPGTYTDPVYYLRTDQTTPPLYGE
ncbi:hypothetical protein AB0L70_16705 [Kribbella sp. NPDC051952]|uniref:hypothetical protein n=1 Tax=Kribbella sp. NPDC051952 TaxID=3154851 RepID=UPI00341A210A